MILCYIIGHKIKNIIDNSESSAEFTRYKDLHNPMCLRCGKVFK